MQPESQKQPLIVYEPFCADRQGIGAWRVMFRELREYRELIWRLISRNISGQFRQSFLRYVWVALPPIVAALVFTFLRRAQILSVPQEQGAMPYAIFVLVGTTCWAFFQQVTIMATTSISNSGSLVSKVYFPREILVFSSVGNAVMNLCIRGVVVVATFIMFGYVPHWQVIFIPFLFIPVLMLGTGLGMLFAPVDTMMRDMSQALTFFFQFGMFLVPAVYRTPSLTEVYQAQSATSFNWKMFAFWVHNLNPVAYFIRAAHSLIEDGTFGNVLPITVATCLSFITFLIGWRFLHICEPLLAERL